MNRSIKIITITALLAVGLLLIFSGCNKAEKQPASKAEAEQTTKKAKMVGSSGMSTAGLAYVTTADNLYSCSHHPYLISDKPGVCQECNMSLTKMSDEDVAKLRASHPKGCPMCNVVLQGDSEVTKCEKCGMALVAVPGGDHSGHNH
ncbi:hypothetical protein KKA00_03800 [bacterium]|nr:hypothetical protein [bacterium]